jgi:hypothetical protein
LVGVLIVGAIPIFSTVRILQANALRNEQARADSALSEQLQNGLRELGRLGDNASTTAHDLADSPIVQRAVITRDSAALRRVARRTPGLAIYLGSKRVAGGNPWPGVQRAIWLTVNGVRAAKIVASVPLGPAGRRASPRTRRTGAETGSSWRSEAGCSAVAPSRPRAESYGWPASTTAGSQRWCPTPTAPA